MIEKQDWEEWQRHPVTKAFKEWLDRRVKAEQDLWGSRQFNRPTMEETAMLNVAAVERVQAFGEALALDYETFFGDMSDEHIRTETEGHSGIGGTLRTGGDEPGRDLDPESGT